LEKEPVAAGPIPAPAFAEYRFGGQAREKASMAEGLDSKIRENATGPESAGADGVQVKQHNLRDQIEADKYLAGKAARRNPVKGFVRAKIVPPGSV